MTTRFMEINLLPEERVRDKYSFGIQVVSFSLLSVLTIVFGILGFVQVQSAQNDVMNLKSVTFNQTTIQNQINKLQGTLNRQSAMQSLMQGNSNMAVKPFVNQVLSALPKGASYTDIHITGNSVAVSGMIQSLHDVATFEDALAKLKQVSTVSMGNVSVPSNGNGLSFTLKVSLGGGNG